MGRYGCPDSYLFSGVFLEANKQQVAANLFGYYSVLKYPECASIPRKEIEMAGDNIEGEAHFSWGPFEVNLKKKATETKAKMCQKCEKLVFVEAVYCPYCGEKLELA